ncbi:membrane protein FxsA [Neorhizobium sp. T786]|uniref:FxsA family protein n=1 Tax=Pseudorhizobium xiangyangii TaxID=2883104 RepID=UPI001CFF7E1A|nr:FxsA family protein [Neorhizobium xiangyangii]MCB5202178.1 membrane protein FxsA [Neorhizobium xiangyangii]
MRTPWIAILFLLLPLAEIAGFVVVGQMVGVWGTLGLVLLSGVVGIMLLRIQGLQMLRRLSEEGREGRVPGDTIVQGAMIVVAAVLFIVPGFVTDLIGLALLIPFVRRTLWSAIGRRVVVVRSAPHSRGPTSGRSTTPGPDGPVVDLDDEDFRRDPNPSSPWSDRRIRDE